MSEHKQETKINANANAARAEEEEHLIIDGAQIQDYDEDDVFVPRSPLYEAPGGPSYPPTSPPYFPDLSDEKKRESKAENKSAPVAPILNVDMSDSRERDLDARSVRVCPVCFWDISDKDIPPSKRPMVYNCGHSICNDCDEHIERPKRCPTCKTIVTSWVVNFMLADLLEFHDKTVKALSPPPVPLTKFQLLFNSLRSPEFENNNEMHHKIGIMYLDGTDGAVEDIDKAVIHLERAANADSKLELAVIYSLSSYYNKMHVVNPNYEGDARKYATEMIYHFEQRPHEKKSLAVAYHCLAVSYMRSGSDIRSGSDADLVVAFGYLRKVVQLAGVNIAAAYDLARFYNGDFKTAVKADYKQCAVLCNGAVESGFCNDAEIGTMLRMRSNCIARDGDFKSLDASVRREVKHEQTRSLTDADDGRRMKSIIDEAIADFLYPTRDSSAVLLSSDSKESLSYWLEEGLQMNMAEELLLWRGCVLRQRKVNLIEHERWTAAQIDKLETDDSFCMLIVDVAYNAYIVDRVNPGTRDMTEIDRLTRISDFSDLPYHDFPSATALRILCILSRPRKNNNELFGLFKKGREHKCAFVLALAGMASEFGTCGHKKNKQTAKEYYTRSQEVSSMIVPPFALYGIMRLNKKNTKEHKDAKAIADKLVFMTEEEVAKFMQFDENLEKKPATKRKIASVEPDKQKEVSVESSKKQNVNVHVHDSDDDTISTGSCEL